MTAKRFMVDDCGTLLDMHTRDTFDYVSDVCGLLNEQHEENQGLHKKEVELGQNYLKLLEENEQLKDDKQHLHQAMSREEVRHKQFKDKVFDLIDAKIKELSTTIEYGDVHEDLRIFAQQVLLDLKKEFLE